VAKFFKRFIYYHKLDLSQFEWKKRISEV